MKFSPLWYVIFGLAIIFVLYILFDKDPQPNGEKIKSLEYAIAISDQQKKDLEDKHKTDSTASAQKIAQLRDSLSKEQKHGVKLSINLARLKANPVIVKIRSGEPLVDSAFRAYDSLISSKNFELEIQGKMIRALEFENKRITANFLERLQLSQSAFDAQKQISDSYKKSTRKVRRANRLLKVGVVVFGVGGLFLGSQL